MTTDLRARLHAALDSFLDALDAYRAAPAEDDLVKLSEVRIEAKAKTRLVRSGKLRVVRIGRELFTRRSYVARLVDELPPAWAPPDDDLAVSARRHAKRAIPVRARTPGRVTGAALRSRTGR